MLASHEENHIPNAYSTTEVAQCMGFSVRQLDYWARQGLVRPSIQKAQGQGSRRGYSLDDLVQLCFIRRLKQNHWSTQKVRLAMQSLREVMNDPNPLKNALIVHEKGMLLALFKTKNGERVLIDALSAGGQHVMGIVLETLTEETLRELSQRK